MKETQYERCLRILATVAFNGGDVTKAAAEGIIRGDFIPAIADMVLEEEHSATVEDLNKVFDLVLNSTQR